MASTSGRSGIGPKTHLGSIVYVIDAEISPTTPYTVTVKAGSKPFTTLDQAEVWLQSRVRSGSKLERC